MSKIKIIDLFAGVGGLSYGFAHDSRFEIIAANEILKPMADAYAANHPKVKVYCCDIKNLTIDTMRRDLGIQSAAVDIIVGGPPCQAYSTVGKRLQDDPRAQLFQEYYRVLKEVKPKFFLYENVNGLLSMQNGELIGTIVSLFRSLGYGVEYKVLNAADFGVPQLRQRVIIVGSLLRNKFLYPEATHYNPDEQCIQMGLFHKGKKPYLTLADAIGDLPLIQCGESSSQYASEPLNDYQQLMRENAPKMLMDHNAPNCNPNLVNIMKALPDGGTPEDLPENMRPKSGFKNTYCRLWWNKPCTTITRNLGTPSSSRCIHPRTPRPLTTREGARIQSFPDNYVFCGAKTDRNLQIGNAVPPLLSKALTASIVAYFKNN